MAEETKKPSMPDVILPRKPKELGEGATVMAPNKLVLEEDKLSPTRYGDWEKNGRCIDF